MLPRDLQALAEISPLSMVEGRPFEASVSIRMHASVLTRWPKKGRPSRHESGAQGAGGGAAGMRGDSKKGNPKGLGGRGRGLGRREGAGAIRA